MAINWYAIRLNWLMFLCGVVLLLGPSLSLCPLSRPALVICGMDVKPQQGPKIDGHYHCINNIQSNQLCQSEHSKQSKTFYPIDNFRVNAHHKWETAFENGMNSNSSIAEIPKPNGSTAFKQTKTYNHHQTHTDKHTVELNKQCVCVCVWCQSFCKRNFWGRGRFARNTKTHSIHEIFASLSKVVCVCACVSTFSLLVLQKPSLQNVHIGSNQRNASIHSKFVFLFLEEWINSKKEKMMQY